MRDMVLILNFDGANSRAIAQALRAEQIYCKIVPPTLTREAAAAQQPLGLILAGGTAGSLPGGLDAALLNGEWPVFAMGDAAALLCRSLGGDAQETVLSDEVAGVHFTPCPLTAGMDDCERMLRRVRRLRLPDCAQPLAISREETVGLMHATLPLYGVQFALEQNDTDGMQLLLNFALHVCGCSRWWNYDVYIDRTVEELRRLAGGGRALCAMTGGLGSGICALLSHRALGDRLQCIFIDTGLMRENEGAQFLAYYRDQMGLSITHVQAQDRFLAALEHVTDAGEKRRVIGEVLQHTLDETAAQLGEFSTIIRSTTCSDILSGADLRQRPGLRGPAPTVEPLRELFKDEVRQVGAHLDMPEEIRCRPSFPGSGLALRILGEVTPARLQTLRAADRIFDEEIAESGLSKRLGQHFALLSPLPGNDPRSAVLLRAVQSARDAQQAFAARLPYDLLERITERMLRERPEIVHVAYDLTPSSRATGAEWL